MKFIKIIYWNFVLKKRQWKKWFPNWFPMFWFFLSFFVLMRYQNWKSNFLSLINKISNIKMQIFSIFHSPHPLIWPRNMQSRAKWMWLGLVRYFSSHLIPSLLHKFQSFDFMWLSSKAFTRKLLGWRNSGFIIRFFSVFFFIFDFFNFADIFEYIDRRSIKIDHWSRNSSQLC